MRTIWPALRMSTCFSIPHYGAHTTASDALWAGCPVLTCPGETFASRVAGSLLNTLGLPELIADSEDDYCRRAIHLINTPMRLTRLRERLAEARKQSALFDMPRFADDFANTLNSLAQQHEFTPRRG